MLLNLPVAGFLLHNRIEGLNGGYGAEQLGGILDAGVTGDAAGLVLRGGSSKGHTAQKTRIFVPKVWSATFVAFPLPGRLRSQPATTSTYAWGLLAHIQDARD